MGERYPREHPEGAFLYQQLNALNAPLSGQMALDRAELSAQARSSRMGVPTVDEIRKLKVPTLFLVGGEDLLAPPEIMRMTSVLVQNSAYVEVPGSGHSTYFENAHAFNQHVGAFLAAHVGQEASK